jgi:SPFH domain/Band 7 family protein
MRCAGAQQTILKMLREYERAVVFTLDRFQKVKGPRIVLLIPFFQEPVRVDPRIQVIEIPTQDVISRDNIRTVELTENMIRAIAKQAEAERDRRAKIIHAEAGFRVAQTLVDVAEILASVPTIMQLRYPQTLAEIGAEQNSTVVFPMPIDIIKPFLQLLEKTAKAPAVKANCTARG